ncbi:hypothetical protein J14TS2_27800 [Bacillus sp. J14TS2]|uniref:aminoglycoside phosphotransferase family protein n=1 Tax=Bacillus sp. J14TS2 TaxID=2807188 RepID=UPI001B245A12|nr:aminoglycoside phosphotransferase family protein [Bacillus sp. J14TS2]GIN72305.1 hypothetical protein J14TS2_27800 [Bacillus sp. J14TS2]
MKVKYPLQDSILINLLKTEYHLSTVNIHFIPMGDSAYSYKVTCHDGHHYYLKLFDHENDRQVDSLSNLYRVLPLLWRIYSQGALTNISLPIENIHHDYKTAFADFSVILFHYIEGRTLADAYPLSNTILYNVGKIMATIHQTNIEHSPLLKDNFDLSFEMNLRACIDVLEESLPYNDLEIVVKKKEYIFSLLTKLHQLRSNIFTEHQFVFCHGDLWGGNLIQKGTDIHVIDWESAILAPREYDLFNYMGEGFEILFSSYQKNTPTPIELDLDLLRMYTYKHHLRNLTNWLMNIIYRNKNEKQNLNDIEMILHHCLNRLDDGASPPMC